jgi:hypothetical protein
MSVQELERAVTQLNQEELSRFTQWFDDFCATCWDKQIAQDIKAQRLDKLIAQAHQEFESGHCQEM